MLCEAQFFGYESFFSDERFDEGEDQVVVLLHNHRPVWHMCQVLSRHSLVSDDQPVCGNLKHSVASAVNSPVQF